MVTLKQCAAVVYEKCFKLKKSESVLIVFDDNTSDLAEVFFMVAKDIARQVVLVKKPVGKVNGEEPSSTLADALKRFDVSLLITSKSLTHTVARKSANLKGVRIASMPGIDKGMALRALVVDYPGMRKLSVKIGKKLSSGKKVRVTTKAGTDVIFSIAGRKSVDDFGDISKKGGFDNLPSGETFIAPVESSVNGVLVIDQSMAGVGKLVKPIEVAVVDGKAVVMKGGADATKLWKVLSSIDDSDAFQVAEFGIGTNVKAKITGKTLEDEKVFGTCHFAFGNNINFGGVSKAKIHLDGIMKNPKIYIDDKLIFKDGKLLI